MASTDGGSSFAAEGWIDARTTIFGGLREVGLRERAAREPSPAREDRSAFAGPIPRQRPRREHAGIRARVLMPCHGAIGQEGRLPRVVVSVGRRFGQRPCWYRAARGN